MKSSKVFVIVGLACAGLGIVGLALCGGLVYFSYFTFSQTLPTVSARVDDLFQGIHDERYAEIYQTDTTPEFRRVATAEQFDTLGRGINTRLGRLQSKRQTTFNIRQVNAKQIVDLAYVGTFEKGTATIRATFQRVGEEWQVMGFRVESPAFQQDLATHVCPHCGAAHTANAKFCPGCGRAVEAKVVTPDSVADR